MPSASAISRSLPCITRVFLGPVRASCFCAGSRPSSLGLAYHIHGASGRQPHIALDDRCLQQHDDCALQGAVKARVCRAELRVGFLDARPQSAVEPCRSCRVD